MLYLVILEIHLGWIFLDRWGTGYNLHVMLHIGCSCFKLTQFSLGYHLYNRRFTLLLLSVNELMVRFLWQSPS